MYSRVVIVIIMLCCQIGVVGATTVEPISLPSQAADHTLVSTPAPNTNDVAINKNVPATETTNNVATADQVAIAQTLKKEKKSS